MYQRLFQLYLKGKSIESSTRTRSLSSFHIPCLRCGPWYGAAASSDRKKLVPVVGNHSCCRHHFGNLWKGIQVILIRSHSSVVRLDLVAELGVWRYIYAIGVSHGKFSFQIQRIHQTTRRQQRSFCWMTIFKQFDGILIYNNHHVYKHIYIYNQYIYICISCLMYTKTICCWLNHP